MEMKIVEKGKDSMLLEFKDIDLGFCYAIVKQLLLDKRVLNAWANKPHPLEPVVKMYILKNALQEALNKIEDTLQQLKQNFITALSK